MSHIYFATWKSTASTYTERFLSSLMAFISIFRLPIVMMVRYYLAVEPQNTGRDTQIGRWVVGEQKWRMPIAVREGGTLLDRDPFDTTKCVDQCNREITIRRNGIIIWHISFLACTSKFDVGCEKF